MTNAAIEEMSRVMDYYNFIRWAVDNGYRAWWSLPSTTDDTVRLIW